MGPRFHKLQVAVVAVAAVAASFPAPALESAQPCAATIAELRLLAGDVALPLVWEETTMADGKPLRVAISESQGALFVIFIKAREGLWAESAGRICKAGADLEVRFASGQIRLGPAANWMLRAVLGQGGSFTLTRLGADRLRIATTGWSGEFVAGPR